MSTSHGTLTAQDLAWAVEAALTSHQHRWIETLICAAENRDAAVTAACQVLSCWGTFGPDGRVAGQPFAPPGYLTVERDGRAGLLSIPELVDACRTGTSWQQALF
ncbi:MAG: hypothetical protein NVS1B12_17140 [Acidimicrobiales bacterium]